MKNYLKTNVANIFATFCLVFFLLLITFNLSADCSITKGEKVVFSCKGDSKCSGTKFGYTLECDGTKVAESNETETSHVI